MASKKWQRSAIALGLSTAVMFSLTGCGDDESAGLKKQVKDLQAQNQQLMTDKSNNAITEQSVDSSLQIIDESGSLEFFKLEDKIIFPNELSLPDSSTGVSDSIVRVGSSFAFTPSDNWVTKIKGSEVQFNHPANVWGSIKSVSLSETVPFESYKPIIQGFFSRFPKTNIAYRSLFLDEYELGVLARAEIKVDKKDHVLNVGFVSRGEVGVLFMFDYEDNKTGIQQELVDTLIGSGTLSNTKIKLD